MSSSQSEGRLIDASNQNRKQCFFMSEKNDASNQKQQKCVSFTAKFPAF